MRALIAVVQEAIAANNRWAVVLAAYVHIAFGSLSNSLFFVYTKMYSY